MYGIIIEWQNLPVTCIAWSHWGLRNLPKQYTCGLNPYWIKQACFVTCKAHVGYLHEVIGPQYFLKQIFFRYIAQKICLCFTFGATHSGDKK